MSRIGRQPIPVPASVKVAVADSTVKVEGPKGKLAFQFRPENIQVAFDEPNRTLSVTRVDDERASRELHGLTRSIVANMVHGVVEGYVKKLEIVGVGYQAQLKGPDTVALQVGFANTIVLKAPEGVVVQVPDPTHVHVTGPDKQKVGQFAATIRKTRPPEPYKGKGIRYEGEVVRRKAGKAFGK